MLGLEDSKKAAKNWGHHVICIDPDAMVDGFAARAASIIKTVAESHLDGVRLPGDSSNAIAKQNTAAGTIPVPKKVLNFDDSEYRRPIVTFVSGLGRSS